MAKGYKYFSPADIALMEHNIIKENDVLETQSENMMWYLAGVHDFAEKLINIINESEGDA